MKNHAVLVLLPVSVASSRLCHVFLASGCFCCIHGLELPADNTTLLGVEGEMTSKKTHPFLLCSGLEVTDLIPSPALTFQC